MSDHTPEPWTHLSREPRDAACGTRLVRTASGKVLARLDKYDGCYADARRIVACVNACKEWTTEQLEAWAADPQSPLLVNELTALRQQVADLRAALKEEQAALDALAGAAGVDEDFCVASVVIFEQAERAAVHAQRVLAATQPQEV